MSLRMMAAVYLAMSRPVWKRFCSRMRATDSGLMPLPCAVPAFDELLHLGDMALIFVGLPRLGNLALIGHLRAPRLAFKADGFAHCILYSQHSRRMTNTRQPGGNISAEVWDIEENLPRCKHLAWPLRDELKLPCNIHTL